MNRPSVTPVPVEIRPAAEGDVTAIQSLFNVCYGDRYSHPEFVSRSQQISLSHGFVPIGFLPIHLSPKLSRTDTFLSLKPWE